MTRKQLLQSIEKTFKDALSIVDAKNRDYAGKEGNDAFTNFKFGSLIGIGVEKAILSRVVDKIARLNSLINSGEIAVKSDSISDNLTDMINYLAIMKAYIDFNEKKES